MAKRGYHHGNLRQALVEAALRLIEVKGPTGFTLSEAAKQAGVTPAAVYRHFEGQEDLIAEAARNPHADVLLVREGKRAHDDVNYVVRGAAETRTRSRLCMYSR